MPDLMPAPSPEQQWLYRYARASQLPVPVLPADHAWVDAWIRTLRKG